ncbi:X-ray repair cross-complementing protein 5-like isoform X2 [Bacillus rossius redtenbacheri]
MVLDVGGPAVQKCDASGSSFLDKSCSCVSKILQRKIFAESKDEVGLVLMGTEGTDNSLGYEHISVACDLQLVSWDMLESLERDAKPSGAAADWLDALVVAVDFLREQAEGKKFTEWKVVLLSSLGRVRDPEQVDIIVQTLLDQRVSLVVIGPDPSKDGADSGKQLAQHIVSKIDGVMCSFEDALEQLMFFQNKAVQPAAWKVIMEIGSTIKIPVAGYRKISTTKLPSWRSALSGDGSAPLQERSYFKDDEMQTEVSRSDLVRGYLFGSTIVPIGDVDEAAMGYRSGPRALSVLGFTARANIRRHFLLCDTTQYFTAQAGSQAGEAMSALVLALQELDMVAIARKVYNAGNAPVMGVLFPKSSPSSQVLVFAQLPFSEDMREFVFPPLPRPAGDADEETTAVDQLIDAMFLEGDALEPRRLVDPLRQHWYSCLAQRALHPDQPPPPLAAHLGASLSCPLAAHERLADTLARRLTALFPLEEAAARPSRRGARDVFKRQVGEDSQPLAEGELKPLLEQLSRDVVQVGTLSPADDFLALLKQGEPFPSVCQQMAGVIEKLVTCSFGTDDYGKAVEAARALRTKCRELNPQPYNEWLPRLRKKLEESHKAAFLELLRAGQLGPISSEEHPGSTVSVPEAGRFFDESSRATAAAPDDLDEEDLFDQM